MPRGQYDRSKSKIARLAEGADAYVLDAVKPVAAQAAGADVQVELAFWNSVQNSRSIADLEDYLEKFPGGTFEGLAERRVRQLIAAESRGGEPEDYDPGIKRKQVAVNLPHAPMPVIGDEIPKYQLLAPFFAEDNTMYPADKEIEYLGPPNEHMYPLNDAAKAAKKEQEGYLDACWAVKCKVEGKPVIPRPRELADQIEVERNNLRASGGVVLGTDLPPTRPDLRQGGIARDPRASRVGKVTEGTAFKDRPTNAPLLGRDGGRYQKMIDPTKLHETAA